MNRKVPDDVSLIVYDDLAWTAAFDISAVSHSFEAGSRSCQRWGSKETRCACGASCDSVASMITENQKDARANLTMSLPRTHKKGADVSAPFGGMFTVWGMPYSMSG